MKAAAQAIGQQIEIINVITDFDLKMLSSILRRATSTDFFSLPTHFRLPSTANHRRGGATGYPAVYFFESLPNPEVRRVTEPASRMPIGRLDNAGKILSGTKPVDLPVVQATKFKHS